MRAFGSNEYGNKDGFKITCCKCGREGWAVPIHCYNEARHKRSLKITLEFRCLCGNRYGATIHGE